MSSQTDFQKARLAVHREVVPADTNVRHDGDSWVKQKEQKSKNITVEIRALRRIGVKVSD